MRNVFQSARHNSNGNGTSVLESLDNLVFFNFEEQIGGWVFDRNATELNNFASLKEQCCGLHS